MSEPLVEVVRADLVDAIHRGDLAVVDSTGTLLASVGDPRGKLAYWRSAAKPFQAMPVISSGAAERWAMTSRDLAIIAGSHNGEPVHASHAAELLATVRGEVPELICGAHPPMDPDSAADLLRRREEPSALHNNCSGKHIGMLAVAEQLSASRTGYGAVDHPVQVAILDTVCAFSGLTPDAVAIGIDGCGVPTFGTSVYHLALAFARLMHPVGASASHADAAQGVRQAMAAFPYQVAGRGRLDTELMQASPDGLVAKGGACGVQCIGLPGGIGLAVKIEDGFMGPAPNPSVIATIAALQQLGLLEEDQMALLAAHARPQLRNVAGQVVGEARARFELSKT